MPRDLKGNALPEWSCTSCKANQCNGCTDVLRVVYDLAPICKCKRAGHSGEPRNNQIMDPADGTVYAPGLSVTSDGKVSRT